MRFANGEILFWLWASVLLFFFLKWTRHRRKKILSFLADKDLLIQLADNFNFKRKVLKDFFILSVFVLSVIALARPQFGFEWQEVKRQGLDIFVAIDTSRSMLTQDVKPHRLERAKLAVRDLLKKLRGDRIGLIAFAGDAFLVCPLTVDYNGFMLSLEDLDTNTIPKGGTNIAQALKEALKGYKTVPSKYKAVIIITDGENLEEDPLPFVKRAKEQGIRIYTIGMGTIEGDLILYENDFGKTEYLKDSDENFVKSRLNENLLQKISLMTGGIYVRARGARSGLDIVYDQELAKFEKRDIDTKMEKKYFERFQIPLGLALLILVIEICLTTRQKVLVK